MGATVAGQGCSRICVGGVVHREIAGWLVQAKRSDDASSPTAISALSQPSSRASEASTCSGSPDAWPV